MITALAVAAVLLLIVNARLYGERNGYNRGHAEGYRAGAEGAARHSYAKGYLVGAKQATDEATRLIQKELARLRGSEDEELRVSTAEQAHRLADAIERGRDGWAGN